MKKRIVIGVLALAIVFSGVIPTISNAALVNVSPEEIDWFDYKIKFHQKLHVTEKIKMFFFKHCPHRPFFKVVDEKIFVKR